MQRARVGHPAVADCEYGLSVGQFLMQMSGWMGSGKSTIATAFGRETGAVVLDHDTTKTAVMAVGIAHPPAGAASYEVLFGS